MCRPKWKHGLVLYHPPCYLRAIDFPAASVNISSKSRPPMNHVAFLETALECGKTHSFRQKIFKKANRVKWIEAKQLSFIYFLFCYYSPIYFIFYYFIFSPSTISSTHVRTMRTGSYAPAKVLILKIASVLKALDKITQLIRKPRRGLRRLACVADALNLLYKWFRRVRGPAATQATDVLLFTSDCRLPKGKLEAQTFDFPHNLDLLIDMSNMGSHFLPRETITIFLFFTFYLDR